MRNIIIDQLLDLVSETIEPKDYLEVNKIEEYFTHLLIRMGKEQDLD